MFLLSGDAIVNESMLTGESVPMGKIPIKDQGLSRWKDSKDINGETAKSFLYAGTRVVRIREALSIDGARGRPALAVVARTGCFFPFMQCLDAVLMSYHIGFNTTKGALVRSMLFPKPMGFKFYRDSIRFIGVLAGLAGLGFCVSAVQFVRLGVCHLATSAYASPLTRELRSNGIPSSSAP
jgi:cation-transporting ATPase 13A3/4/5